MIALLWIIDLILLLVALYLLLIAPSLDAPDSAADLMGWLYAHRGLHDMRRGVPENSMKAFKHAVDAGYGIELDVHPTLDGQLVVFHDADLKRVCGVPVRVADVTYEQLTAFPLPDGSVIPLLADVLALVDGRVPLIVEIKHYGNATHNASLAVKALRHYRGPYCMESFHPLAVRHVRKNAPGVVCGQLADGNPWKPGEMKRVTHFAMKHLLMNAVSRPHFVAYSYPADQCPGMWLMKRFFRPVLCAWTIRDQATLDDALEAYQMPIFEGFLPQPLDETSEAQPPKLRD